MIGELLLDANDSVSTHSLGAFFCDFADSIVVHVHGIIRGGVKWFDSVIL